MKKSFLTVVVLLLIVCSRAVSFAETASPLSSQRMDASAISLLSPAIEGDSQIQVQIMNPQEIHSIGLWAASGENILSSNRLDGSVLSLSLLRTLRCGEELTLLLSLEDSPQAPDISFSIQVESIFQQKLRNLERRAGEFWDVWQHAWLPAVEQGQIDLPLFWRNLPFVLYPDEAPEITVRSSGSESLIFLSENLPAGWRICTGKDLPVILSPCELDETRGAWIASDPFDSVFLLWDQTEGTVSISIEYSQSNSFRPSYPVVEWIQEKENRASAFNCYGWGNSRSYEGGMIALVIGDDSVYAEYDAEGAMTSYVLPAIGCVFQPDGQISEGTLPEGYIDPVRVY